MEKRWVFKDDGLVKSRIKPLFVISTKVGIQSYHSVRTLLDPGFHRGDDFLLVHQGELKIKKFRTTWYIIGLTSWNT
jgi:hypothetical protein